MQKGARPSLSEPVRLERFEVFEISGVRCGVCQHFSNVSCPGPKVGQRLPNKHHYSAHGMAGVRRTSRRAREPLRQFANSGRGFCSVGGLLTSLFQLSFRVEQVDQLLWHRAKGQRFPDYLVERLAVSVVRIVDEFSEPADLAVLFFVHKRSFLQDVFDSVAEPFAALVHTASEGCRPECPGIGRQSWGRTLRSRTTTPLRAGGPAAPIRRVGRQPSTEDLPARRPVRVRDRPSPRQVNFRSVDGVEGPGLCASQSFSTKARIDRGRAGSRCSPASGGTLPQPHLRSTGCPRSLQTRLNVLHASNARRVPRVHHDCPVAPLPLAPCLRAPSCIG